MKLRERAAMIASQFEGRCTCATMDGGVDCPWCGGFYDVLRGFPLEPAASGAGGRAGAGTPSPAAATVPAST